MKIKPIVALMLLSLIASAVIAAVSIRPAVAANDNVVLSITPTPVNKVPGDVNSFFDVYVNIADVTGLFGFDIKVTWGDNTLITLDNDTSNTNTAALLNGIWGAGNVYLVKIESSGGGGGGGYYRYVALSTASGFTGTNNLMDLHFQIKKSGGNFALETTIQISAFKLSDPNYTAIPATTHSGLFHIAGTTPDLELVLINPNGKPFEYCKTFGVEVYATHVTNMTDFDLTILFNSELLAFVGVDHWGVFGTGSVVPGSGSVRVTGAGAQQTGTSLLLFALTFHVEFDDRPTHIWRTTTEPNTLDAAISISAAAGELSFDGKTIPTSEIPMPLPITVTIHLIRGDVDCNGNVDIFDLGTIAHLYDAKLGDPIWPTASKYDLNSDNIVDIFDLVIVATNFGYPH